MVDLCDVWKEMSDDKLLLYPDDLDLSPCDVVQMEIEKQILDYLALISEDL